MERRGETILPGGQKTAIAWKPVCRAAPAIADAPARPQPPGEEERTANNAVYIEGLGAGLLYSINYERSFSDFAVRVSFSYWSVSATSTNADGSTRDDASASVITVPVTLSYLGIGSKRNIFELGAGATVLYVGAGGTSIDGDSSGNSNSSTVVLPDALVGYRYMPPDGGFLCRVGIAAIFAGDALPVLPLPYLSLGGAF